MLAAAALTAPSTASATLAPSIDPFYAPPADLASVANGDVIRSRETHIRTFPGMNLPYKVYQVAFRSTDRQQLPIVDVATIILPLHRSPDGIKHLISYQTAYDGVGERCQPSYSFQTGRVGLQGAETIIMAGILKRGWGIVTSDYEGPDNAFLVRDTNGRGVLDGIRAAERFAPSELVDGVNTQVGLLGYSGGGQATAYASELAGTYAPELNIVGAGYGGVAVNMEHAFRALDGQLFSGISFAAVQGLSAGYPEIQLESYLNRTGKKNFSDIRGKYACIQDYAFTYAFKKMRDSLTVPDLSMLPHFSDIIAENTIGQVAPKFPLYWYQTVVDEMDGYKGARKVARGYCAGGTPLTFTTTWTEDHALQAFSMPWKAQDWMAARFAGKPAANNCGSLAGNYPNPFAK